MHPGSLSGLGCCGMWLSTFIEQISCVSVERNSYIMGSKYTVISSVLRLLRILRSRIVLKLLCNVLNMQGKISALGKLREAACPVFRMRLIIILTCVESQSGLTFKFDK